MDAKKKKLSRHLAFQRRLANYLRSYRLKHNISSKEMSKNLGYASSRYSRLESENIPYERFISSLEFLKMLAEVKKMSLSEFVLYLEGNDFKSNETLSKTDKSIINLFENISSRIMRNFLKVASTENKKEKESLESILNLYLKLKNKKLSEKSISALDQIIDELSK